MRSLALVAFGFVLLGCAEQPAPRSVVVVPRAEPELAKVADAPHRDLPWPEPASETDEPDPCAGLAANVPAHAAWAGPNMLRLELGPPPEGTTYAPSEPVHLVGAKLRSKLMTPEQAVVFLDLSAFRIGVLANVPLACGDELRRVRVMVMPDSGTLQYGNDIHVVRKDVP